MKDLILRRAEILCVGTELLMGDIVNTNAAYLSRQLPNGRRKPSIHQYFRY